jgi:hypothetical protein
LQGIYAVSAVAYSAVMRIHDVRDRRSADDIPHTEHLAWRIAKVAADPVAVAVPNEAMVINQFDSDIYNFALEGVTS